MFNSLNISQIDKIIKDNDLSEYVYYQKHLDEYQNIYVANEEPIVKVKKTKLRKKIIMVTSSYLAGVAGNLNVDSQLSDDHIII